MANGLLKPAFVLLGLGMIFFIPQTASAYFIQASTRQISVRLGDWLPPEIKVAIEAGDTSVTPQIVTNDSQVITLTPKNNRQEYQIDISQPSLVSFDYQIKSEEHALGFDEPALLVALNDQIILQKWRDSTDQGTNDISDAWQHEVITLPVGINQTLSFQVNNTGDQLFPTKVELFFPSQLTLLLREDQKLVVESEEGSAIFLGGKNKFGKLVSISQVGQLEINALDLEQFDDQVQIWAVDVAGNTSSVQTFNLILDFDLPQSVSSQILYRDDQEIIITWITPDDDSTRVDHYFWRLFDIANQEILSGAVAHFLPYQLAVAKPAGEQDWLVLTSFNQGATEIEIIAVDVAGNLSLPTRLRLN